VTATPRRTLACLAVAGLLLAACSADPEPQAAKRTTASPTPSATATASPTKTATPEPKPRPHLPLTGRRVAKGKVPPRPAVVVKVDNTGSARPQVGLPSADLVVEELVEGGRTRLAVFLHSRVPKVIGPVRSQRTSDIGIVKPTRGVLAASGAAPLVRRRMDRAGIPTRGEGSPGYFRSGSRSAPYDLMLRPWPVSQSAPGRSRPKDYLPWAEKGDTLPKGFRVRRAAMRFSPAHTTRWDFTRGQGWRRTNGVAAAGQRFHADNLLVVRVATRSAGYRDPAGAPVPETVTTGHGQGMLLRDGRGVPVRWRKPTPKSTWRLTTRGGKPLRVPAGRTWIELVPRRGGVHLS
jgi:hypothetical protein